jgi:hypothetical protein
MPTEPTNEHEQNGFESDETYAHIAAAHQTLIELVEINRRIKEARIALEIEINEARQSG